METRKWAELTWAMQRWLERAMERRWGLVSEPGGTWDTAGRELRRELLGATLY